MFRRLRRLVYPHGPSDLATIPLPGTSIEMSRCGGRDQVLEQALREGWESFEQPLPHRFRDAVLRTTDLVVDVGANTGFYSLLAARCGRRVLAFEPVPGVREILNRNVKANRLEKLIKVSPLAVSDRIGKGTLYMPDPSHGLIETSSSLNVEFKPHASTIEVDLTTLDASLPARRKIGIVKVDAEGHEGAVLRGAEWVIRRDRPILFVEVLPRAETDFLTGLLSRLDYVDVPLGPDGTVGMETEVQFVPDAWNHAFIPRGTAL